MITAFYKSFVICYSTVNLYLMLYVMQNPPFMMKELERKHSHGGGLKMCAFLLTKVAIERKMPKALKPKCIIQKYA